MQNAEQLATAALVQPGGCSKQLSQIVTHIIQMIMNSKRPNGHSIIKTGLAAVFAGLCIGIFYVCYEWNWNNLLSGIVAGIAFTQAFFITTVVWRLSKDKWRLYFHSAMAGVLGGLAWWLVARTDASVFVPMMVGGVGAPIAMWLETRNWNARTG